MQPKNPLPFYLQRLQAELDHRKERNARYSIRAFSRFLGIDVGTVSRLLRGHQTPSYKMSLRLFQKLLLSDDEQRRFSMSIADTHRLAQTKGPTQRQQKLAPRSPQTLLDNETYRVISEWYHPAILELT